MDDRLVITIRRHGLTAENERRAYIGWTDVPLSEKGSCGAKSLAKRTVRKAELVCSSPLKRCVQTARIFYPQSEIILMDEFKELNFGCYERKTYDELKDRPDYRRWLDHPFKRQPLGGESFEQFSNRLTKGWQRLGKLIKENNVQYVTLFTHGGVLRYLLSAYAPKKKQREYFLWHIPYSNGYELHWSVKQFLAGERCDQLVSLFSEAE